MMRTSITTRKDTTTLTIVTSEDVYLERTDVAGEPRKLSRGEHKIPVTPGTFQVLSKAPVTVTADSPDAQITLLPGDKDGGPIDPARGDAAPR
jgi:hypothetical protein